jgi:hypothetical protein
MSQKWAYLTEGLDLKERRGIIPPELIKRLDLIYDLGDKNNGGNISSIKWVEIQHSKNYINRVPVEIRKIYGLEKKFVKIIMGEENHKDPSNKIEIIREVDAENITDNLYIFATITNRGLPSDFATIPLFCTEKKHKDNYEHFGDERRYNVLFPIDRFRETLIVSRDSWREKININPTNRKGYMYIGNNPEPPYDNVILLKRPLPFDFNKRLILARSPNNSVEFDSIYKIKRAEEGKELDYYLIYENVASLIENKIWALNKGEGIKWEDNPYLNLFTR